MKSRKSVKSRRSVKSRKSVKARTEVKTNFENAEIIPLEKGVTISGDKETRGLYITASAYNSEPLKEVSLEEKHGNYAISLKEQDGDETQVVISNTLKDPRNETFAELEKVAQKVTNYIPASADIPPVNEKSMVPSTSSQKLILRNNILLPEEYPVPKPKLIPKRSGSGYLKSSKDKVDQWKKNRKLWKYYVGKGKYPFFAGSSNQLVPTDHWINLKSMKAIAEKPSYLSDKEKKDSNNYSTTMGNQVQTRIRDGMFIGIFEQKRSGATVKNPTPTLYKTKEVRVDDDDIGNYIAFTNNLYAWGDGYLPYMYVKQGDKWVVKSPDPLKVNRAHVKSMLDSAGFEQGKIVKKIIKDDIGKVLTFRDTKGTTQNLALSEQQMAIMHHINNPRVMIVAKTPRGKINFNLEGDVDVDSSTVESIQFVPTQRSSESKLMTSDDLLLAVVRRHGIEPDTAQALAESLYRQGWITYPRTDDEKATVDEVGIKLLKDASSFNGSQEEWKILKLIADYNNALEKGIGYMTRGKFILSLGDTRLESEEEIVFADEDLDFGSEAIDLVVEKEGVNAERLTSFLVREGIGTPATRTQLLAELRLAGVISVTLKDNERVYQTDQRGLYMSAAYEYLLDHPNSRITELGRRVRNAGSLEEVKDIWESYQMVDAEDFRRFIQKRISELLERERDLRAIEAM